MKFLKLKLSFLACFLGLGLGELAWALACQRPDFLWPDLSHAQFLGFGALLGLLWAWSQALYWRFSFSWTPLWGLRIGTLSLWPALFARFWTHLLSLPLPPPHDFPLRKIQIFSAAVLLLILSSTLLFGLFVLVFSNGFKLMKQGSLAMRLGALAFFVYFLSGAWTASWNMTGDAPHYLLISENLLRGQGFDLKKAYANDSEAAAQNYEVGAWRRYYDFGVLEPQVPDQSDGREISEHKPGLPLLLLPAYFCFQMSGVRLTLAFLAALGSALFFLLCLKRSGQRELALFLWVLFSFSAPWWTQSQIVLTEMPGALLLLCVLAAWEGILPSIVVSLGAAAFFWLNVRFFPLGILILVMELWRQRKAGFQALAVPLLLVTLSVGFAFYYNFSLLGTWSLTKTYDQRQLPLGALVRLGMIFRYASGVLIDQEYGWLPYVPVYAIAIYGFWALAAQKDSFFWRLLLPSLLYIAPVISFPYWASAMAPNRYVVPLTAVWALGTLEAFRAWGWRPVFLLLSGLSLAYGLLLNILPWLCWGKLDGHNILLKILSKPLHLDLCAIFPSFWIEKPDSYFWVAGLSLLGLLGAWRLGLPPGLTRRTSNPGA